MGHRGACWAGELGGTLSLSASAGSQSFTHAPEDSHQGALIPPRGQVIAPSCWYPIVRGAGGGKHSRRSQNGTAGGAQPQRPGSLTWERDQWSEGGSIKARKAWEAAWLF